MRSPRGKDVFARAPGVFGAMLEVTGGRWPKNVPIPHAAGEDFFTSRIARDLKIFPYGRNIAAVVSAVMEKDRQYAAQKRRAVVRLVDPFREVKKARAAAKSAAPGSSKPLPAAKPAALGHNKALAQCEGCWYWREQATPGRARERTKAAFAGANGRGGGTCCRLRHGHQCR
jgi:hypothetical protein